MIKKYFTVLFLLFSSISFASHPFNHDLHLTSASSSSSRVMIVAHGMGGNYTLAKSVKAEKTLVSFNFPDHDYGRRKIAAEALTFGTIDEVLPLIFVIKQCVIEEGRQEVDLYGFSAGGGAIVNAIGALNTKRFDSSLENLGIGQKEKCKMLEAIQRGVIILDVPLKSVKEIIDLRGPSKELELISNRYQVNDLEPIESLKYLQGLSLHFIVHFQNPDEMLSNRDDDLFFTRLKKVNANGTTQLVVGSDGGHNTIHHSLWDFYNKNSK